MAMFLSRIKKILNLGTKSITANGTYNASSDGYDGYSSVEVNVPQITPTSITPSNSSPAQMTANTPVNPTTNGYAIESYTTKEVYGSTVESVSEGIYRIRKGENLVTPKITGRGITEVTPSNSNPVQLYFANVLYSMAENGYAISSYSSISPSNSSPVSLSSGSIYKPSASGYAISSYSNKTPSDSNPPSISSGAIIKASASGYLYASSGLKDVPTYFSGISATTNNSSGTNSVSVTSGKKYLLVAIRVSTGSASDCSITSGATVNKTYVNNTSFSGGKGKLYVVMCTATSSTITVAGTNNILSVLPLN